MTSPGLCANDRLANSLRHWQKNFRTTSPTPYRNAMMVKSLCNSAIWQNGEDKLAIAKVYTENLTNG